MRGRVQDGYEFRDIIVSTRSSLRQMKLYPEAEPWYNWLRRVRTLNFFGFDFGDLVQVEDAFHSIECPLNHGMPNGCDFLAAPLAVLEIIAQRAGLHTRQSVNLAEKVYWDKPETSFTCCYFDGGSSSRCVALIDAFGSKPNTAIGESKRRVHDVFSNYPSGAVLVGQTPKKTWHRQILTAKAANQLRGGQGPSSVNDICNNAGPSDQLEYVDPIVSGGGDNGIALPQGGSGPFVSV